MELFRPTRESVSRSRARARARTQSPPRRLSNLAKLINLVAPIHPPIESSEAAGPGGTVGSSVQDSHQTILDWHENQELKSERHADALHDTISSLGAQSPSQALSRTASICNSSAVFSSQGSTQSSVSTLRIHSSSNIVQVKSIHRIEKKLFVAPEIEMTEKDKENFNLIRARLVDTLRNTFKPKTNLDAEVDYVRIMAGPTASKMMPTILLLCCNEPNRQRLYKILKREKWIKDYNYWWQVIVDPVRKLSRGFDFSGNMSVKAFVPNWHSKSLLGTLARVDNADGSVDSPVTFTIGGIITVQGKPYGLTVSHAFQQKDEDDVFDTGEQSDSDDSLSEDDESDPISVFESMSDIACVTVECANVIQGGLIFGRKSDHESIESTQSTAPVVIGEILLPPPDLSTFDWALVDLSDAERWHSNQTAALGNETSLNVQSIFEPLDELQGEVTIYGGVSGAIKGAVQKDSIYLRLGNRNLEVWQIMLETSLVTGDSGSWVIQDGKLCGHIIAGRHILPVAYMIRMDNILAEIKSWAKTQEVRLLGPENISVHQTKRPVSIHSTELRHRMKDDLSTESSANDILQVDVSAGSRIPQRPEELSTLALELSKPEISMTKPQLVLRSSDMKHKTPQSPSLLPTHRAEINTRERETRRHTEELFRAVEMQHERYLRSLRALHDALPPNGSGQHAGGSRPASIYSADSTLIVPSTPITTRRAKPVHGSYSTRKLTDPGPSSLYEADTDSDVEFLPLLPTLMPTTTDSLLTAQRPIAPYSWTSEDLEQHLRMIDEDAEGTAIALGDVWRSRDEVTAGSLLNYCSSDESYFACATYEVYDVGRDSQVVQRHPEHLDDEIPDTSEVWDAIKSVNSDFQGENVVGKMIRLSEPSPMMLTAAHCAMSRHFDMDELYQHLVATQNSGKTQAYVHRAFEIDGVRRKSFFFVFKYYTAIGPGTTPAPWQAYDNNPFEYKTLDHIDIAECSAVLALSLEGPPVKELRVKSHKRKPPKIGALFNTFAPWHLLCLESFPDDHHTRWDERNDLKDGLYNGPHAFLASLAVEYLDAVKRFSHLRELISKLITPPSQFMFDTRLREKLLFEDRYFTYSRRYFWAYNTLGVLNESIKSMMAAYFDTFTSDFWAGRHATLWPLLDPGTVQKSTNYLVKINGVRDQLESIMNDLKELFEKNERTRKEIVNLREQLFSGSSVKESRRAIEQGDNVKVLTGVSMIFLPLTFVVSVFGITEFTIPADDWRFPVIMVCVGVPFFLGVFILQTRAGMEGLKRLTTSFRRRSEFISKVKLGQKRRLRRQGQLAAATDFKAGEVLDVRRNNVAWWRWPKKRSWDVGKEKGSGISHADV